MWLYNNHKFSAIFKILMLSHVLAKEFIVGSFCKLAIYTWPVSLAARLDVIRPSWVHLRPVSHLYSLNQGASFGMSFSWNWQSI